MRLHRTGFFQGMYNVYKNITGEAKLISPSTHFEKPSHPQATSFDFMCERSYVVIHTGFDANISIAYGR